MKIPIFWGTGKEKRDFIYIEDLVKGCLNQICFTKGYDVSNICYGESVSISEVVYNIFDILKKSKNKIFFDKDKPTTIPIRRLSNIKAKGV